AVGRRLRGERRLFFLLKRENRLHLGIIKAKLCFCPQFTLLFSKKEFFVMYFEKTTKKINPITRIRREK
ncbi:MAG: hypothetical protein LIP00_05305, partial [Parabacteroides sp.]|nr:hypothetical protein [Parabacteroides sp.]